MRCRSPWIGFVTPWSTVGAFVAIPVKLQHVLALLARTHVPVPAFSARETHGALRTFSTEGYKKPTI
jgi:hypothetical protein